MKSSVLGGLITLLALVILFVGLALGFSYLYEFYHEYTEEQRYATLGENFYLTSDQILETRIECFDSKQARWVLKLNDERTAALAVLKVSKLGHKVAIYLDKKPIGALEITPNTDPKKIALDMSVYQAMADRSNLGR